MPVLFAYLIAVALLLGGGYGALSWLAAPEPVKVAKAKRPAAPPHRVDGTAAGSAQPIPPPDRLSAGKPEVTSKPDGTDQANTASQAKTASSQAKAASQAKTASNDQRPSAQPEIQRDRKGPAQEEVRSPRPEMTEAAASHETTPQAEAAEAKLHAANQAPAKAGEKQPVRAISPGFPQSIASKAPASATIAPKQLHVRQASRHTEKRPLQVMTLRTIELPDGRRMTRLVPYRTGNYRERGLMAFGPDE